MNNEHTGHKYDYIKKLAEKYRKIYDKRLQLTTVFKETLSQACSQISKVEARITAEENASNEEIDCAFEVLYNTLEENKRSMKRELSQKYQPALENLSKQKRETESIQAEVVHVTTLIEGIVQGEDETLLLSQEELIASNVKKLQKQIGQLPLTVSEPQLPVPEIMDRETMQQHLDACNFLYTPADPQKCLVEGDFLRRAETGKYYILMVNLVDSKGNKCLKGSHKIKAELRSARDDKKTTGRVKHTSESPENVNIIFESQKRGRNELSVTTRGAHIANSPQSIYIHMPPSQLSQPIVQIRNLDRPIGITHSGNSILAIEHSRNRILKFNTSYEVVATYGERQLRGPSELTTDGHENIYVCTILDHRVHKFTRDGAHIKSIGTKGVLPGQFNSPNGIRINNQEELYVCDSRNNRIQVFDLQLDFKRIFGKGKGQFSDPSDVDFDSSGNIYVTDSKNHRIQVFTPQERYIRVIGYKRFGSKELEYPLSIHIVNDFIFVTEHQKNHVTVFKTSGELVTTFGKGILEHPEGIEVDIDGYVYVTSHFSRIFVF
jgi:DNA-binding beta-propeller fold protein YncE